ncbi:MAG TPA: response regulator [Myxococcales bacterium]|nr:response regulator [Myxococcales bacterium]
MPRSVLVVDDSPTIRGFARLLLRSLDVKVVEAEDGAKALAAARADAPALVLADVNMPVMDGLALTRELRKDRALKDVPVLLLTGEKSEELRQKGREAGANELLTKPLQAAELQAAVRRWLGDAA